MKCIQIVYKKYTQTIHNCIAQKHGLVFPIILYPYITSISVFRGSSLAGGGRGGRGPATSGVGPAGLARGDRGHGGVAGCRRDAPDTMLAATKIVELVQAMVAAGTKAPPTRHAVVMARARGVSCRCSGCRGWHNDGPRTVVVVGQLELCRTRQSQRQPNQ